MSFDGINFDRLRTLYKFIRDLTPEQVDMDQVMKNTSDIDFSQVKAGETAECGAIGCAMGWAGLIPSFRADGLKFTRKGSLKVDGQIRTFDSAAAEFFNMDRRQVMYLFGPLRASEPSDSQQAFLLRTEVLFMLAGKSLG